MSGRSRENTWRAALVEIEDALVPGFIIEEFEDGRYTVFVPSIHPRNQGVSPLDELCRTEGARRSMLAALAACAGVEGPSRPGLGH
jgi:hypothetical protein